MLARAVKPNCDGLHDMAKQLLIWGFKGKRKFGTRNGNKLFKFRDDDSEFVSKRRRFSSPKFKFKEDFSGNLKKIDWKKINLEPFTKDFYNPDPKVLNRSPEEIRQFLRDNEIQIRGENCPAPVFSFEEAGLSKTLVDIIRNSNFSQPTPIQAQGMPIALSGKNMVGIARTGSGKTLAFILPAIIHIKNQQKLKSGDGPIALILGPTRELIQQTMNVTIPFAKGSNLRTLAVYGGSQRYSQERELMRGVEICIATPGRLLDFLRENSTNLRRCTYLVLDEADTMFDMGFEPQIRGIIEQIRPDRQVLMWSATWPKEIRALAEEYLGNYVHLTVGSLDLTANPNINQIICVCGVNEKKNKLKEILEEILEEKENKTLIFVATKLIADKISNWISSNGVRSESLHGGKTQRERDFILKDFRSGRTNILVATDVAARGLDVTDIKFVINFDFPNVTENYIHRIGRTGRHNSTGTSYTLFTEEDAGRARELISILREANQEIDPQLLELAEFANPISYKNKKFQNYNYSGFYRKRYV